MNFRTQTYRMRLSGLEILLENACRHLRIAETVTDHAVKPAWLQRQREQGRPGFMLKQPIGPYPCGCLAGPGRWLRCEFSGN